MRYTREEGEEGGRCFSRGGIDKRDEKAQIGGCQPDLSAGNSLRWQRGAANPRVISPSPWARAEVRENVTPGQILLEGSVTSLAPPAGAEPS